MSSKVNIRSCSLCVVTSSALRRSSRAAPGMKFSMLAADLRATQVGRHAAALAGDLLLDHLVELAQRGGLHAVQLRDAQQHFGLHGPRQFRQHARRQVRDRGRRS